MSVTANIETRSRTNALCVPIQCVTTRLPTNSPATNAAAAADSGYKSPGKTGETSKPVEIVFVVEGDHARAVKVKDGISDDNYTEIIEGLHEGDEVVSGSYKAINRDLEDGKKVALDDAAAEAKPKAAAN
jgi:HlyD family secretion protein